MPLPLIVICKNDFHLQHIIIFVDHFFHFQSEHPWQLTWFPRSTRNIYATCLVLTFWKCLTSCFLSDIYMSPFYAAFWMGTFVKNHTGGQKITFLIVCWTKRNSWRWPSCWQRKKNPGFMKRINGFVNLKLRFVSSSNYMKFHILWLLWWNIQNCGFLLYYRLLKC